MKQFAARREQLCRQMVPGGVAILATAPEVARNADTDYPYRHDSYFYYLTGFTEPEAVLVAVAANGSTPAKSVLFCRAKNPEREIWDGFRYGPEAAREAFCFDQAFPIDAIDTELPKLLANAPAVYYPLAHSAPFDARIKGWLDQVRGLSRSGVSAPASAHDLLPVLSEMRLIKDDGEQAIMQRAAAISGRAHERAMQATRPGMFEYELEAELLHEFRRSGAQFPAYTPIVASGAHACVLHYTANNARLRDGDLVLIDAGCELDSYASDITRTWPVSGRFTEPQRQLYELVLAAQAAALAAVAPGQRYSAIHEAATGVLAQGMLDLGLLDKAHFGSAGDVVAQQAHQQFYMHGTGHWLGLDVHDCGAYRDLAREDKPSRILQAGMALTVEPGIYVRPAPGVPEQFWNIGIRIEDDVVVTPTGCKVLSGDAPKRVEDIEKAMRRG